MDVRALKDEAATLFRRGKFSRAAERYEALVKAEPRDVQHLIKWGDSLRRDGRRDQAIAAYCKAVDAYVAQGIVIKAIAACKLVLELDPEQSAVQEVMARLCDKRYVRRDQVGEFFVPPPQPSRHERYAPIELPDDGDDEEDAGFVTAGGDVLEFDATVIIPSESQAAEPLETASFRDEPRQATSEREFDFIELANAPVVDEVAESTGDVVELEIEVPLGEDFLVEVDSVEHRVLMDAEEALRLPTTAVANILADAILIDDEDDDDGEEIELLSISTGLPSVIVDVEPPPVVREEPERLANELAFDTVGDDVEMEEGSLEPLESPAIVLADDEEMQAPDVQQERVPLLSELPEEAFLELITKVAFHRVDDGEVILREGDEGRSIFILASGRATVIKGHGTSAAMELATLDEGAFFGEMALLNGTARVASVVASGEVEVLELTETLLRELTARHASVAQSLKKFYRQRLLSNVMAISPLFRAFDQTDRRMLVEKFKLRELKANEPVITEGERPDGLYVVMHGLCLVTRQTEDGKRRIPLAILREGDVFGEMSLLTRQPASATVLAKRRTLVLRLPKSVFDELMFTHPAVLEVVSELTDERNRVNEQIMSGLAEPPADVRALL